MRVFSQGQLGQGLARAIIALFVWSMLGSGIATLPASAQVSTRSAANSQSTAVVPFCNLSAYHPDTLGLEVAALLAADFENRLSLDVVGAEDVAATMKNLGQKVPLDTPSMVRLASEIPTNMLVWGEVREAKLVIDKNQRRGQVTLAVHLFSRVAQGDVNGALVTACSPSDLSASGDELINSALKQAVFQAITEMKTRPSVTAHVIWAKGDEIFTNSSTRGGMLKGMKMAAVRDSERIAEVLITDANSTGADGKVTSGSQLRTGDYLLALYDLPGDACPPTVKERVVHQAQGLEKLGVGLGALLLLAGASRGSSEVANGSTNPADFLCSGLSNEVDLGYSQPLAFPTNMVTWTKYSNTQSTRVIAYMIFRNNLLIGVASPRVDGNETTFFDLGNWIPQGIPGCSWLHWLITLDSATGTFEFVSEGESWAPVDNVPTYEDWSGDLFSGLSLGTTIFELGIFPNPFLSNIQVYYQIQPVIIENVPVAADVPNWQFKVTTTRSAAGNTIIPTTAAVPSDFGSNGTVATFSFYHPSGADEMVLQVQRDQGPGGAVNFATGPTTYEQVLSGVNPDLDDNKLSMQAPISALQALSGTSNIYWWRIGSRNRADAVKPRAWPLNPNSPNNGWIWSFPVQQFTLMGAFAHTAHPHQRDRAFERSGAAGTNIRRPAQDRPYSTR